jgi:hypothetical protein
MTKKALVYFVLSVFLQKRNIEEFCKSSNLIATNYKLYKFPKQNFYRKEQDSQNINLVLSYPFLRNKKRQ